MIERDPGAPLTPEEMAEMGIRPLTPEQLALKHPFQETSERRRIENAANGAAVAARGPTFTVRKLAQGPIDGFHVFPQYKRPSQLSAILQAVSDDTGARFSSSRELSLVDGACVGLRVTYKGQK